MNSRQPVTDNKLIADLEVNAVRQPINDPALIAQLEGNSPKSEKIKPISTRNPKIDQIIKDFKPLSPEEQTRIWQEGAKGAAQSLLNYPLRIANLFPNQKHELFDFAPETKAGAAGELAGDIGSFFLPGGILNLGLKGLSRAPMIGHGVNALRQGIQNNFLARNAASLGRTGGETALFSAAHHPENAEEEALKGGGIGVLTQTGLNLAMTQNPVVKLLARAGVGGILGQGLGHPAIGATAGVLFPQAMNALGLSNKKSAREYLLEHLDPVEMKKVMDANRRLGTVVTPGQASGNYPVAGIEGTFKRTPESAQEAFALETAQEEGQRRAIQRTLDSIYKPTPQSEANISALYNKANQMNINPKIITQLRQNKIMNDAFDTVRSDPAFAHLAENNYEFLSEVGRQLGRDYRAMRMQKPNAAHTYENVRKQYDQMLKQMNTDYAAATKAAQPKIVRRNIEERFNRMEEGYTGKNFYSKFLDKRKTYQEILRETKNFPEAQQAIKDMRVGWRHLSNKKTVSQSEAQAKSNISQNRNDFDKILNAIEQLSQGKRAVENLKFIYSPHWDQEFARIMERRDRAVRNRELANLLGKIALANGLE